MMTYQEQIKHPKWQKKRLEVMKLRKFKCQACGAKEEELHIHHPFYKRGAMIWEYDKTELECLCHRCHKDAHAIDEKIKKALATCKDKEKVLAFILSLSPTDIKPQPAPIHVAAKRGSIARPAPLQRADDEEERLYKEYPHLRSHPDDTDEQSAEKFFARMKLLIG